LKKKIFIFSTSRADYNYTFNIFKILKFFFKCKFIITGTHYSLLSKLDYLKTDSRKNKYIFLHKKKTKDLSSFDQVKNILQTNNKVYDFLIKKKPDLVVLFGDRYEILGIASACVFLKIPLCHFYGGETKDYMNLDTQVRNAVTKMSHLHFVSSNFSKQNVLHYGENRKSVFVVGKIRQHKNIYSKIKFSNPLLNEIIKTDYAIVTFHSINLDKKKTLDEIQNLLDSFKEFKKINFIWCGFNSDPENYIVIDKITKFCKRNINHYLLKHGIGGEQFYTFIKKSKFFIGNSSSIFLDCPTLGVPAINVGVRQKGRPLENGIYSVAAKKNSIAKIIKKILKKNKKIYYKENIHLNESKKLIIKTIYEFLKRKKIDQLAKKDE
jgi:GDP/UDP-N,N'-diacetylbacillosamine 2-epimerase (hydrolysing)